MNIQKEMYHTENYKVKKINNAFSELEKYRNP